MPISKFKYSTDFCCGVAARRAFDPTNFRVRLESTDYAVMPKGSTDFCCGVTACRTFDPTNFRVRLESTGLRSDAEGLYRFLLQMVSPHVELSI